MAFGIYFTPRKHLHSFLSGCDYNFTAVLCGVVLEFYLADLFLLFPPPPHSRGWGWCLDDAPLNEKLPLNLLLPGVLYSAAHQCRLQYGSGSLLCDDMDVRLYKHISVKTEKCNIIYICIQ